MNPITKPSLLALTESRLGFPSVLLPVVTMGVRVHAQSSKRSPSHCISASLSLFCCCCCLPDTCVPWTSRCFANELQHLAQGPAHRHSTGTLQAHVLSSAPRFQSLPREMEESGAARPGKNSKDSLRLTLPAPLLSPAFPRTGNPQASHPSFPQPSPCAFPYLWGKSSFSREIAQNMQGASIPTALECVPPLIAGGQRAEIWEKKIIKKKKKKRREREDGERRQREKKK